MGSSSGFSVHPATLDASAEKLVGLSGDLQGGRPDAELVKRGTGVPFAHADVATAAGTFIDFAADQFQDSVALLAALSSHLKHTAANYRSIDADTQQRMESFLTGSTLQAPR